MMKLFSAGYKRSTAIYFFLVGLLLFAGQLRDQTGVYYLHNITFRLWKIINFIYLVQGYFITRKLSNI